MTDSNQHFSLDEIRSALAEWNDMGAVEQMREDANGWVGYMESLIEQLEACQRDVKERMAVNVGLIAENTDLKRKLATSNPASEPNDG